MRVQRTVKAEGIDLFQIEEDTVGRELKLVPTITAPASRIFSAGVDLFLTVVAVIAICIDKLRLLAIFCHELEARIPCEKRAADPAARHPEILFGRDRVIEPHQRLLRALRRVCSENHDVVSELDRHTSSHCVSGGPAPWAMEVLHLE